MSLAAEEVYGERYALVVRYVDLLTHQGVDRGLIGPREVDRLWDRHILNCVALSDLVTSGATLADVGSGAGLPGVPLALLRPDLTITLIEPLLRRSTFLTQAVDDLGISANVRVLRARAEDHRESYDVVASRALAPLGRLLDWCAPLRRPDGVILALKGRSAEQEVAAAAKSLRAHRLTASVLAVRAHPDAEPTTVVRAVGA